MKALFVLLIAALVPSLSHAGGSVGWEDVQTVLARKPALKKLIESTFTVDKVGGAVRLGRHFENLGGLRIAPYEFRAVAKDGTVFHLTINCDQSFVLADGTKLDSDDERFVKAAKVVEVPTGFTVSLPAPEEE